MGRLVTLNSRKRCTSFHDGPHGLGIRASATIEPRMRRKSRTGGNSSGVEPRRYRFLKVARGACPLAREQALAARVAQLETEVEPSVPSAPPSPRVPRPGELLKRRLNPNP